MDRLEVFISAAAEENLDDIGDFLLESGAESTTILHYLQRIRKRCSKIAIAPHGGIRRDDIAAGIRMVPFERTAVILYLPHDDRIEIVNIFHGGRNYSDRGS